jgi:hypothetical protein
MTTSESSQTEVYLCDSSPALFALQQFIKLTFISTVLEIFRLNTLEDLHYAGLQIIEQDGLIPLHKVLNQRFYTL